MEVNLNLVKKAKKKDPDAFTQLYQEIYKDLYRFALYTLGNVQDAEDVVSECVMSAFEQISKLRKEEAFASWMFQILANRCKRKRKEYLQMNVPLEDEILQSRPDLEELHDLRQAFQSLRKDERMVIALTVFGGYNSREAGEILHMNENTVRMRKSQGFEKMREFLK